MNMQIHYVVTDITGVIRFTIVDAVLAGYPDGAKLAKLTNPHIKANAETIRKSLEGSWRSEHPFTLCRSAHRNLQSLRSSVTQIPSLEEDALQRFSEVGRDTSRWPSAAHFS